MDKIYLDYAATTPIDPRVVETMLGFMGPEGCFANPASGHLMGLEASEAVEQARASVASFLHAQPEEIIWTSGATEANNLALQGAAHAYAHRGKHIITVKTEHKATLDTCAYLESQGFEVSYLSVDANGLVCLDEVKATLRSDTILMSVMWVNNETGVIQPIAELAQLAKDNNTLFHVDAVQGAGKVDIDLTQVPIDLLSLSAHKIYGPKGIGVLYRRKKPKVRLQPLMYGGGHEQGLRSGTLPTHQIVGMAKALSLLAEQASVEQSRLAAFKALLWQKLQQELGESVSINGGEAPTACHILNVCFDGMDGESLRTMLAPLAVSNGSACNTASIVPSHVLSAMGLSALRADSSLRFSFGRFTTEDEVLQAAEMVVRAVKQLHQWRGGGRIW